jgi:hypothetical protein
MLEWAADDVPALRITAPYGQPWDEASEVGQRRWMGRAANQFVNSLRPRLQRLGQDLAA